MQRITERVYAVPGMSVGRIYVVEADNGLALIDTSLSPQTAPKLETQLKAAGYSLNDLRHILITHAHPDHIGGLAEFQRLTSARTLVHRRDAPAMRGETPILRPRQEDLGLFSRLMASGNGFPLPTPARVDQELKEGDVLDEVLPGLTVIETHGHSPGHVSYWWPEKRLLFGGDLLMRFPWGLMLPIAAFTPDMSAAKRSIRRVADMDVDIHCFGHGGPLVGNASAALRKFADRLK